MICSDKSAITMSLILLFFFLSSSCATVPLPEESPVKETVIETGPYYPVQEKLVEAANWARGRTSLEVRGRSFSLDCTGIVLAAYYYAGIDLAKDFGSYTGNGVRRLYFYLNDKDLLYNTKLPEKGDIVFWDNTWDANENGSADDDYTHVGMVVTMDQETGLGSYLHYNYSKGITIESINLLDPDNAAVNAPMRMRSLPKVDGYRYLSSQLVHDLGRGYELELD